MQRAILVINKVTQIREYLEQRSILTITDEYKNLSSIDIGHFGIVDVNKFVYIYYNVGDDDISFRADMNMFRNLLASAFFNTDEAIFILVDNKNPMIEDLIHSACRNSKLTSTNLSIIHHDGVLTLSDVTKYITGEYIGNDTSSAYKSVYIREGDSEETARFPEEDSSISTVLPLLTDHYGMYKKRAEVEAVSSSRFIREETVRPTVLDNFNKVQIPSTRSLNSFVVSGDILTGFENAIEYFVDYYSHVGMRCMIIDMSQSDRMDTSTYKNYSIGDLRIRSSFDKSAGYLKCRFNQLGFVAEMIDNISGVDIYVFLCDSCDYIEVSEFVGLLSDKSSCIFVTHFDSEAVESYLNSGMKSKTLFLSDRYIYNQFDLQEYKERFEGTRVAMFNFNNADTTSFVECALGGVLVE